ncbi:hypothetical protein LJR230_001091 [Trinickia sp. LjRoot230]|uniref:hypothetical protein n=1 Tax=Trinickia sp. LjRoot230 TaxID=3342288 RepID=UPI003ECE7E28
MRINVFKHFFSRFLRAPHTEKETRARPEAGPAPALSFDPFWHGDHWQNLLACPMDARHYVVEDWAPVGEESATPRADWPRNDKKHRRSH